MVLGTQQNPLRTVEPMKVARAMLKVCFEDGCGLKEVQGRLFEWYGGKWVQRDRQWLEDAVWRWTEDLHVSDDQNLAAPWGPRVPPSWARGRHEHSRPDDSPPSRRLGDRLADRAGWQGDKVGSIARRRAGWAEAHRPAYAVRHGGERVVGQLVRCHDHQRRSLEAVTTTHRIERVLQVVPACRHVHPARPEH